MPFGVVVTVDTFPGKIGVSLDDEVAAAVPGYLGRSTNDAEVEFCFEAELTQEQSDDLDAVVAAHDPATSEVEDAIANLNLD